MSKKRICTVYGCNTCPLSIYKTNDANWYCGGLKTKLKRIDCEIHYSKNSYPSWCPLKKELLTLVLFKN